MKTFIFLILGCLSIASKPVARDEKICQDTCNATYTRPYKECNGIPQCELYVSNQYRRCVIRCKEQSE